MQHRRIRKLDAGEHAAFQALYDWPDYGIPELPESARTRLKVFF
jgi:hypothetical protein